MEGSRQEQLFNGLLLDYLAAAPGGSSSTNTGSSGAAAARRFVCSRMLHDAIFFSNRHADGAPLDAQALSLLLVQHRQLQDSSQHVLGGRRGLQILQSIPCDFCKQYSACQHNPLLQLLAQTLQTSAVAAHHNLMYCSCRPWHG
jgi:hypothetical protein